MALMNSLAERPAGFGSVVMRARSPVISPNDAKSPNQHLKAISTEVSSNYTGSCVRSLIHAPLPVRVGIVHGIRC